MAGRHDQLLEFLDQMTLRFRHFKVVAVNQSESNPRGLPISEVTADESDSEICLIRGALDAGVDVPQNLGTFYLSLRTTLDRYPDYSLMVSEWFQIDDEHTGRADTPLQSVEVDEAAEEFRLLF